MNEISGNKPNKVCKTWVHREVTDLWPARNWAAQQEVRAGELAKLPLHLYHLHYLLSFTCCQSSGSIRFS